MADVKITKKDIYTGIIAVVSGEETEITKEQIVELCEKEIKALDKRSEKAKEKAEIKKASVDPLAEEIFGLLTDEFQTTADITAQIEDQDTTVSKVSYRLRALVECGRAEVDEVEVPASETQKKRWLKGYRILK